MTHPVKFDLIIFLTPLQEPWTHDSWTTFSTSHRIEISWNFMQIWMESEAPFITMFVRFYANCGPALRTMTDDDVVDWNGMELNELHFIILFTLISLSKRFINSKLPWNEFIIIPINVRPYVGNGQWWFKSFSKLLSLIFSPLSRSWLTSLHQKFLKKYSQSYIDTQEMFIFLFKGNKEEMLILLSSIPLKSHLTIRGPHLKSQSQRTFLVFHSPSIRANIIHVNVSSRSLSLSLWVQEEAMSQRLLQDVVVFTWLFNKTHTK